MQLRFTYFVRKGLFAFLFGAIILVSAIQASAQITVTATAGTVGPTNYTTLRAAFTAINGGTHQGVINISVTANTNETAGGGYAYGPQLNASGAGAANYTSVTIKPAAGTNPTIAGNIAGGGPIFLYGANNVTIDGSNTVGGTTQNLTISNGNATGGYNIWIGSGTAVGASNNTIKNCIISGLPLTTGIAINSGSGTALYSPGAATNNNITIQNNAVSGSELAIYGYGPGTGGGTVLDAGWLVTGNTVTGTSNGGIQINNGSNYTISNNTITGLTAGIFAAPMCGIILSFYTLNGTIYNNQISGIANTAAYGGYGIYFDLESTASNVNVYNNYIANITSRGAAAIAENGYGIYMDDGGGINIYENSINQSVNDPGAAHQTGDMGFDPFLGGGISAGSIIIEDNILVNSETNGAPYCIYSAVAKTVFATINYNDYYSATAADLGYIGGAARGSIAAMQTGFGGNLNSITYNPTWVSTTDLDLTTIAANLALNAGVFITTPSITTDIRGTTRITPTIGAFELIECPAAITGTPTTICPGGSTTNLTDATAGGTWASSNTGVATVSTTGVVTSAASGTTTISYTLGTCSVTQVVTVETLSAISGAAFSMCQGSTITLTDATSGGTWSSSNIGVGTVGSTTGIVYGVGTGASVGSGTTTITYTTGGGCTTTAVVTVYAEPDAITGIATVCQGSTTSLNDLITGGVWSTVAGTATVTVTGGTVTGVSTPPLAAGTATVSYSFGSGACAVTKVVTVYPVSAISSANPVVCSGLTTSVSDALTGTWTSSSTGIAIIGSTTGDITGLTAGTSTIVYTFSSGCTASVVLTVNLSPVAISGPSLLCYGTNGTFLDGTPGGSWSSSSPGVATIGSATGLTIPVSNIFGTTTIVYTMPLTGCNASAALTVDPVPDAISGVFEVCTGITTTLTDGTSGGGWLSSDPSNAIIDASGDVTGLLPGTTVISYTLPTTCYATQVFTVNLSPAAIAGNFSTCIGIPQLLSDPTGGGGTWSSTDPSVGSIGSSTGIVSPLSSGTAIISYVFASGCNAATIITVNPSPLPITGTPMSSCAGFYTPLNDASGGGTWSSSNTSIGTVGSTTGLVYAIATGETEILYTYTTTGCYAGAVFTVNPSPVAISGTPQICVGLTSTFNDGTGGGLWNSSDANATVGSISGVVQGVNPGTATIIYTLPTTCFITYVVTITTPPTAIGGPPTVCHDYAITLTDGTSPGTWSVTGGTGTATISTSGVLTGGNMGGVTVSYITPACNAVTYSVLVNPLPDPITGIGNLCVGSGTSLTDATLGGTWSSSNDSASVSSTGVVSGVSAGSGTNISYTLTTGCYVIAPVVVFPIPDTIHGIDSVCPGSSVVLSDTTAGGVWSSSNGTIAKSIAVTGEVDGLVAGTVNISYTLISGCYVTTSFLVENPLPASLTVTQSLDTIKCTGTPDTLTAHPVNGGTPTFVWENWGAEIGTGQIYTFVPAHGDYITCVMTTDDICASPGKVETSVVMNVYPYASPIVNIITSSSSDTSSYNGEVYTFYSNVTYGGTDPGYQWYINSAAVSGATNSTFTTHVYGLNDTVSCVVTSTSPCDVGLSGGSNTVVIYGMDMLSVSSLSSAGNDLNLFPNPNTGSFTLSGTIGGATNKDVQLAVTDMLGRMVYTGTATPQNGAIRAEIKLDNDVAAGTYLLRVNTETGTQTFHFVIGK